jgi:hypothetical protein
MCIPFGTKKKAMRTGFLAAPAGDATARSGASDSNAGRAIKVPSPRKKWRRETGKIRSFIRVAGADNPPTPPFFCPIFPECQPAETFARLSGNAFGSNDTADDGEVERAKGEGGCDEGIVFAAVRCCACPRAVALLARNEFSLQKSHLARRPRIVW